MLEEEIHYRAYRQLFKLLEGLTKYQLGGIMDCNEVCMIRLRFISGLVLGALAASVCSAQVVTSAHSGTVHYFEGDVSIEGTPIGHQNGRFTELKEQQSLRTGQGRAEVLLTPGVFLRVGENSSVRMLDNRLVSTRVEIISGNAILESVDPQMSIKDSPVTMIYRDYEIRMVKHGLVEFGSDPSEMKVYKGEVEVSTSDNKAIIKDGQKMPFAAGLVAEKFDTKNADDLYLWARDRSQSLSAANMTSARTLNANCLTNCGNSGWYYNPDLGMITYIPGYGMMMSPFGFGYFSPGVIYNYYMPAFYTNSGNAFTRPISSGSLGSPSLVGSVNGGGAALGSPARSGAAAPVFGGATSGGTPTGSSGGGFSSPIRSGGGRPH